VKYSAIAEKFTVTAEEISRFSKGMCYALAELRKLHGIPLEPYERDHLNETDEQQTINRLLSDFVGSCMILGIDFGIEHDHYQNKIDLTRFR